MSLLGEIQQIKEMTARLYESLGGVYGDPFNEMATVVAVNDPKKLGRVKVEFQDGLVSDWIYVIGSNNGVLSSQYIGSACLITKAHGRSEDCFVIGFINKNNKLDFLGNPIQVPIVSTQSLASSPGATRSDLGLSCNKGNAGKILVFDDEIAQDVVICKRRNNRQDSTDDVWAWKSLTHSKWVEKGTDPNVITGVTDYSKKTGIPTCNASLEGEVHEFTEDRKFRSYSIICRRVADGGFSWMPLSTPPVVVRTTLPNCDEKIHGAEYVVDSGRDSELVMCLRYQGQMKWVHHKTREPVQFEKSDPPLKRQEFLDSKKPNPVLAPQPATPSSQDFLGKAGKEAVSALVSAVPAFGPNSSLQPGSALQFDATQLLTDIAKTVISKNGDLPIDSAIATFSSALASGGIIDADTSAFLSGLGGIGDIIAGGIKENKLEQSFLDVGQKALYQAINSLSSESRSSVTAYGVGGVVGAIDMAVALGLPMLPPELIGPVGTLISSGRDLLSSRSSATNNVLDASIGQNGLNLITTMGDIFSAFGGSSVGSGFTTGVGGALSQGKYGQVAEALSGFASLAGFPQIPGAPGIPQLATTGLQLLGAGDDLIEAVGIAGLGLNAFESLTGINPLESMLGGIPGLGGLFGKKKGADCPCDPVACRKTSHAQDSDGNNLLKECGNVVANSHSSYDPTGNPLDNNKNKIAKAIGLANSLVGQELCVGNIADLTEYIKKIERMGKMADKLNNAKNADWPELWSELVYTFETIEKGFKRADNNITKVESVERKLIDAQHRMISKMLSGNGSFLSQTLLSIIDTSKAIQDVYNYVKRLDARKKGKKVGVLPTTSLKTVFENIAKIALLNSTSKKEATFLLGQMIKPADKEWKELKPGLDLLNITDVVLGAVSVPIPLNFSGCKTSFSKEKILKDSLESKINSPVPPEPDLAISQIISPNVKNNVSDGNIRNILDQIKFDQQKAIDREPDC